MADFPIFDLEMYFKSTRSKKKEISKDVDNICRNSGFLAIKNHGVKKSIIQDVWKAAETFFLLSNSKKN